MVIIKYISPVILPFPENCYKKIPYVLYQISDVRKILKNSCIQCLSYGSLHLWVILGDLGEMARCKDSEFGLRN